MKPLRIAALLLMVGAGVWPVGLPPALAGGTGVQKAPSGTQIDKSAGPKVVKLAPFCPEGKAKQVDKVGQEDRCYKKVSVQCGQSITGQPQSVRVDTDGDRDSCPKPPGWPAGVPAPSAQCPEGYSKQAKTGRDQCEYSKPPSCISGTLTVQAGTDACN